MGNDDLTSTHLEPTEISEVNDTEAETERLDDSPQKTRRNKNVVLESSTHILSNGTSPLTIRDLPISDSNMGEPAYSKRIFPLLNFYATQALMVRD